MPLTILLVDDHKLIVDSLKKYLLDSGLAQIVLDASCGINALEILNTNKVEIVCMDYHMPNMDGIECTRSIKELYPQTKVLFISSTSDHQKVVVAINAGADGYLSKATGLDFLEKAFENIMAGEIYLCPKADVAYTKATMQAKKQEVKFKKYNLTKRELEVAIYMAQGLSMELIAEKIYRSKKTVEGHRDNIFTKTDIHKHTEFIAFFNLNKAKFETQK